MQEYQIFLAIGGALLCGLVADELGRRTPLPRVTVLILLGVFAGDAFLGIIPSGLSEWYGFLATVALTMVAFLLGGRLSLSMLKEHGKEILLVSLSVVSITVLFVGAGLVLLGVPFEMALVLAGIATATAPAATQDVVKQTGAKGPFTETLLGVVAIDDAWGLMLFSFLLIAAATTSGHASPEGLYSGLCDIGIAVAIGVVIGLPAAYLTGRLKDGEPIQSEALGVVFLCAGTALWLDVSFLLAGIAAGATVVNVARHHARPFHEIEHVEWPFMVLFFVLAGATLDFASMQTIGWMGISYIVLRLIARYAGGWLGSTLAGSPPIRRRWIGLALVPQAGVALGMALIAGERLPEYRESLLAIAVGTTVVFEILGPILTQAALRKVGEINRVD
jgi:Kef-type K+ transport system membrane component KefB